MTRDSAAGSEGAYREGDSVAAGTVACPNCGRPAQPGDRLCRLCWQRLPEPAPGTAAPGDVPRAAGRRRRRTVVLAAIAGAGVVLVAWFARPYILPPGPLPGPSERAEAAVLGPTWPSGLGGVAGRRTSPAPAPEAVMWQAPLPGIPVTAPVASEGHVYLGFDDGTLRAFSAEGGDEVWRHEVPGRLDAPPALGAGVLYVGLRNGAVRAIDAGGGEPLWEATTDRATAAPPVLVDGTLLVLQPGRLLGLEAATGRELWRRGLSDSPAVVQPVVDGGRVALALYDQLLILDAETGTTRFEWSLDSRDGPITSLAFSDGYLVVAAPRQLAFASADVTRPWWEPVRRAWSFGYVVGLTPEVPWQAFEEVVTLGAEAVTPAAVSGDLALVATAHGVQALAVPSGEVRWELEGVRPTVGPAVAGTLAMVAEPDALHLVDVRSGEVVRTVPLPPGTPRGIAPTAAGTYVVVDDRLVALGASGAGGPQRAG